ncbi:BRO-N domain-containing protein, partial [Cetobacterium sp.]|uniref:BRO-N domain-containing protein n=1 Tax=Cetobacterium sp. TaxID=2071632 RepID=UPI003F40C19C
MNVEQRYLEVVKKADILGKVLSVYGDSENPLFLAKDIADWIGHTNVTEMVRNLEDETEKLNSTILSAGQNREMTFLTEDGVYEVLMTSRKKIAKDIRKGLKEFLKAWRKGGVKVVKKQMSELDMIISMANIQKEIENRVETLEDKINNQMTIDYGNQRRLQIDI